MQPWNCSHAPIERFLSLAGSPAHDEVVGMLSHYHQFEFFNTGAQEMHNRWRSIGTSIWELTLNTVEGRKTVLQKYAKNATQWDVETKGAPKKENRITHTYFEEVIIFKGSLIDLFTGEEYHVGYYAFRKTHPAMEHGPYKAGKNGCEMFVVIEGHGVELEA